MNDELVLSKIKSIVSLVQEKSLNRFKKPEIKVSCGDVLWVDWEKKIFTPWMCIVFYATRLAEDPNFSNTNWQFNNWNSETWLAVVAQQLDISTTQAEELVNSTLDGEQSFIKLNISIGKTGKPVIEDIYRHVTCTGDVTKELRTLYPPLIPKYERIFAKNTANNDILMNNLGSLLESIIANDPRYQALQTTSEKNK